MKTLTATLTFATLATLTTSAFAQDVPAPSQVTKEHKWLKKFVGEWEVVSEGSTGEGQPPIKGKAIMKSTMLGGLWVVNSSDMEVAGMKMKSIQMIGYDAQKKKYVGIWADSMINHMWRYEGTLDESGRKLMLDAKGPSMTGEAGMQNYRDAFEFKDDDTIIATSYIQGPDGKWMQIMTGTAKRRK